MTQPFFNIILFAFAILVIFLLFFCKGLIESKIVYDGETTGAAGDGSVGRPIGGELCSRQDTKMLIFTNSLRI